MTLSDVIDTLQTWIRNADDEYDREEMGRVAGLKEALHEIKKIEPCEDAISREDALQALCQAVHKNDGTIPCPNQRVSCLWNKTKVQDYAEEILKLPPVTPQPKTGHWIDDEFGSKCSCCGIHTHLDKFDRPMKFKHCAMCGAKMIKPQKRKWTDIFEREDKTMELKDTIQGMTSDDFKERINAELQQLAIRINKAEKYLHSIKDEDKNANDYIMEKQLDAMKEYYKALWTRAKLFKIDTDETERVLDVII